MKAKKSERPWLSDIPIGHRDAHNKKIDRIGVRFPTM